MPRTLGIDCDLRKHYAVSNTGEVICKAAPDWRAVLAYDPELVLFEIASPLDYTDNKAIAYNKRKWTIWNVAQAAYLNVQLPGRVLVSPSHAWTLRYDRETRHKIAKCTQPQKDLREAECMIAFYALSPSAWLPLDAFLARL